jgi:DinB superfamily
MSGDQRLSGPRSVGLRISHPASAEAAQAPQMTEAERAELVELLLESEREFMEELEGVNERQWSFKLEPDRWSVGEVVEHIVLADGLLFDTATKSLTGQPDAQWDATLSKTETLRRALPDRSCRVDAPGVIQPRGAMPREELLSRFIDQRARVVKYARETDAPLKAHTAANPFFGRLNVHQWLLYIPLHHLRHNQQIAELKASAAYPRY